MSVHRKVTGVSSEDATVQKLREEVELRKAETELARSQLRCVLLLVQEAWQGDETAMRHVSNIAGVQPPFGIHVLNQMQREIEAVQDREEVEEPSLGVYNKCYVVDNAQVNEQELQQARLQATVDYLEAQLQRDRHWRAGMSDQRHEASMFSRWENQLSSPLKRLKSLPTEPPIIHRTFSNTELATTSTADFIKVLRSSSPDITRIQIPIPTASTSSPDTRKQARAGQLKSNSTSACHTKAEPPKPKISPTSTQARAVRFRIPHTEPATLFIAKQRSQELPHSQPGKTKRIVMNKQQSYNSWQFPQCYMTECPAVDWTTSEKESKATRLLQKRLGIGPEGMV